MDRVENLKKKSVMKEGK